jgi:hypothetical protein
MSQSYYVSTYESTFLILVLEELCTLNDSTYGHRFRKNALDPSHKMQQSRGSEIRDRDQLLGDWRSGGARGAPEGRRTEWGAGQQCWAEVQLIVGKDWAASGSRPLQGGEDGGRRGRAPPAVASGGGEMARPHQLEHLPSPAADWYLSCPP